MNTIEHLLCCLGEEGSEVAQDVSKCLRFGLDDRNVLNPTGPTNRERLINELNDLIACTRMLSDLDVLPVNWFDVDKQKAKKAKVREFMRYSAKVGALQDLPGIRASVLECGSPLPLSTQQIRVSYDDLKTGIETCPMTWLPALFVAIVKRCLKENVFQPGAMARYCRWEQDRHEGRKS